MKRYVLVVWSETRQVWREIDEVEAPSLARATVYLKSANFVLWCGHEGCRRVLATEDWAAECVRESEEALLVA